MQALGCAVLVSPVQSCTPRAALGWFASFIVWKAHTNVEPSSDARERIDRRGSHSAAEQAIV